MTILEALVVSMFSGGVFGAVIALRVRKFFAGRDLSRFSVAPGSLVRTASGLEENITAAPPIEPQAPRDFSEVLSLAIETSSSMRIELYVDDEAMNALIAFIHRIIARLPFLEPELRERIIEAFESPEHLVRSITRNGDGLPTAGTLHLCVFLEPTSALLELALAAGAGDFEFRVEHEEPPV